MALRATQLKKLLLQEKLLDEKEIDALIETAKTKKISLEELILYRGLITADELGALISNNLGIEYVNLRKTGIDSTVLFLIPKETAIERKIVVFGKENEDLKVAMMNPDDLESREVVKRRTGYNIKIYYITPESFEYAIRFYQKDIQQALKDLTLDEKKDGDDKDKDNEGDGDGEIEDRANTIQVSKLVNTILEYAVSDGASDVHIESLETETLVRYRVDGILHDELTLPKAVHAVIVARIKIMSNLKIDEHRLPQDGRIKLVINAKKVSFRVSIIPSFFGEKVVMRILEETAQQFSLKTLGFKDQNLKSIQNSITKAHGMILVTGPTGSGKTTSLYTILSILNTPEVNINTVEDPIEYAVPRINQLQVNKDIGLTFAAGLRSFLRQDPDIIMVGEIRDGETASIAVNAAMTGHLVLSTLHTNDAAGTMPRLIDMGVEPFLVASTVNTIIAQRLVRKLCTECRKPIEMDADIKQSITNQFKKMNVKDEAIKDMLKGKIMGPVGCQTCKGAGYKGRIGIYEVLEVTEEIRSMIIKEASADQIKMKAIEEGMSTILEDGIAKIRDGVTTIEEVIRVAKE
ncbi:Flp pilus assembly complex ATPase component TadA [Candidatus Dojkabacteria bacterium]|uniref:Flp pilus assembly complex ATPase component TadA n=1 Tax=Candidatus Dojkabacteria bacterium TaxID=2099670 RepID=A0A955L431_9BACT|nr:Flp pilus assembly complex ATPase component TadA [Candidatus Dojkabacteria bacterium]